MIINFAREIHEAHPRVNVETAYLSLENHLHFRTGKQLNSGAEIMFQLWEQPLRLIVVGGGHVGLAVATLGDFLGFSVTVIDDRDDFTNKRIIGVNVLFMQLFKKVFFVVKIIINAGAITNEKLKHNA